MPYILEVQRFEPGNGSVHVGYMNKIFDTKVEASNYYNRHNTHMRSLNIHNTWRSDWDPDTHLMYVVRDCYCERLTIPPFEDT